MRVVRITLLYTLLIVLISFNPSSTYSQSFERSKFSPRKPHMQRIISDKAYEKNKAFSLIKDLKPNESKENLKRIFPLLFTEFRNSTKQDKPSIYETINNNMHSVF